MQNQALPGSAPLQIPPPTVYHNLCFIAVLLIINIFAGCVLMHKMHPCIVHSIVLALLSFKKLSFGLCKKSFFSSVARTVVLLSARNA